MVRTCCVLAVIFACGIAGAAGVDFDADLLDVTLRIDLFHGGDATREWATFDRAWRQSGWSGSRAHPGDEAPIGAYLATMADAATGRILAARSYDSYFGEYRTTAQAHEGVARTYHETVLFPFPRRPVLIRLVHRHRTGPQAELLAVTLDPADPSIAAEAPPDDVTVIDHHVTGPAAARLDLLFVGEGYTAGELDRFRSDLEHFGELLLAAQPYAAHRELINLRGAVRPSLEPGADEPSRGIWKRTAVGASFDSLGSERYLLTEDNRSLREIASAAPYDALVIMVNHERYGGGGIYGSFATFTTRNQWSGYVLVHELGHSFVGLADEYYTSSVAYNDFYPRGVEPVEPNITALLDPATLKWRDLVTPGSPLPTPWEKAEFDQLDLAYQQRRQELNDRIAAASRGGAPREEVAALEDQAERLSASHAERVDAFLAASAAAGEVGAFEGAGYSSEGLYRPAVDCIMFSKGSKPFCPVCRRAVERAILREAEAPDREPEPVAPTPATEPAAESAKVAEHREYGPG